MLQNHCKGTDFSPNNQKKTQKKITNLMIFLDCVSNDAKYLIE